ncbi:hypothetical protein AO501_14105 [Mycobacterium gordonae]|uniref:ESX secretion-associated protein EspG n=2 Tax=Mycobacterium TaxID=1763 RepID=A0A0Q2LTB1_MYCGO|nr:hypothetical protein [Mycobacterium gordonae]KQH79201.1 hypothetical protein AO501_14105 [Mycobacterium gordonae]
MKRPALSPVGSIDLVDLQAVSDSLGRDFIPHPFVVLRQSRFGSYQQYQDYVAAIPERIARGDLRSISRWVASYQEADLRVECVVSIVGSQRGRIMAHRRDQLGFIAAQNYENDCVDIFEVSPYELGAVIAGSLALTQPGTHPKVVIPGLVRQPFPAGGGSDSDSSVVQRDSRTGRVSVPRNKVTRYTRIQSRWRPARDWGFDRRKTTVATVAVSNDGDYIYSPGFDYLTPTTMQNLGSRIDAAIAEDVADLRESRR